MALRRLDLGLEEARVISKRVDFGLHSGGLVLLLDECFAQPGGLIA